MERQEGKLRAKEALRSLCQIADAQHTGKIPWTEFRMFLNRCQIHLHELTLKSIQDKLISASLPYSSFIDHIDFNSSTSRWFLRPFLSSAPAPRPHPTRQDLLHVIAHKLQKYRIDPRVLQAVKEQFLRLDAQHSGKLPAELFEVCLAFGANRVPEQLRTLITGYCKGSNGQVELARLSELLEEFQYARQTKGLGRTAAICLDTPAYPLESKLKLTSLESLQLEISQKLQSRTSGLYQSFKFFDTAHRGALQLPDLLLGVRKLGIKVEEKDLNALLSHARASAEPLTLRTFGELFGEGAGRPASQSPTAAVGNKKAVTSRFEETEAVSKRKFQLPSDIDPKHSYGKTASPSDRIKDVLSYTFQREWALEKLMRDQSRSVSPVHKRGFHTKTSLLRLQRLKQANKPGLQQLNRSAAVIVPPDN